MKFLSLLIVVAGLQIPAGSQINNPAIPGDSSRVVELQEVVVSSTQKTAQQLLVSFFKRGNSSSLEDIMSRLPELSLIRRGAYGMEPSIRSFTGGQINILIDGMRIHGACTDKMDPATIYIEPANLDNLQVQTGSNSFLNGSSIGGSITMKMADPEFLTGKKITGIISSGYQTSAKSFYESVKLNFTTGRFAVKASATYRSNSNYRSGGGNIIPFSQNEKINYSLSIKFRQTEYSYLKADLLADDGWNIGYPALPMDVGYAAARIASLSLHRENSNSRLYKWQFKIYGNNIRHFMDDTKRPDVPVHMDMPGISKTYGIYSEAEIKVTHKQKVVLRIDGSSTFLKASMTMYQPGQLPMYMLTWPDNRRGQYGLSSGWTWQPDSSLKLQANTRIDMITSGLANEEAKAQVSIFGHPTDDRKNILKNVSFQLSKNLTSKLKISGSLSYAERVPTAGEYYGFYLFNSSDGYDYIGNPDLKKEKSMQAELSALYTWKSNRVQLSYFYSKISGYITGIVDPAINAMTMGANGVKSFINIPGATITGLEFSGIAKPFSLVDIISTLRYTKGKDMQENDLPAIAPLKNINSFRYRFKKISAQLETETALQQKRINQQAGEDQTPAYFLLHTRFTYMTHLFKFNTELQSGIENILDKNYHEHLDWGNIPRPGRNVYIQLKLLF
jgi:iron complex outermembrane receptor protein